MESKENPGFVIPPLGLPISYLVLSTISLSLAFAGAIKYPNDFIGAYYHAHMLSFTHLVTIGWLTANILGLFYVVAPMALQTNMPGGKWDVAAFCLFAIGLSGMVSHFWIRRDSGMAWSAGCVYAAILFLSFKFFTRINRSRTQGFVKLHLYFGFSNILIAASWGLLMAINKVHGFLRSEVTSNLFAHAHLAGVGWICMIVFGMSYRLLPMFLPGTPTKGRIPWITAFLIEIGVLGVFVSLLIESGLLYLFSIFIAAGFVTFLLQAVRTALLRKPAPPPLPLRPDFAMVQVAFSFIFLVASIALGMALARGSFPPSEVQIRIVYAFLALVGFLSQMIFAMRPKILSIFTWYHAFQRYGNSVPIPRPVDMPVRWLQIITLLLWIAGVPAFAFGIFRENSNYIQFAASLLLISVITLTSNEILILRKIFRAP